VYDPRGGESLAPRQQLRQWKGSKSRSDASVARGVREYRTRFPGKAVTVSLDGANGWAVLAAGGSLPRLPSETDANFLAAVPRMKPFGSKGLPGGALALADAGRDYLVWAPAGGAITLDLSDQAGPFTAAWVDPKTGKAAPEAELVRGGRAIEFRPPAQGATVLWLTRK
jgi:hypothetical protein